MAAVAGQELVRIFTGVSLRAQPAGAPTASRNPVGPPQGKWIRLAPFPQATGELLGVAIDGKQLRGIHGEHVPGVHLVAAYAHRSGQVLGQRGGDCASTS